MTKKKLRLKPPGEHGYSPHLCAVRGCRQSAAVIDGTKQESNWDVPLCEKHLEKRLGDNNKK